MLSSAFGFLIISGKLFTCSVSLIWFSFSGISNIHILNLLCLTSVCCLSLEYFLSLYFLSWKFFSFSRCIFLKTLFSSCVHSNLDFISLTILYSSLSSFSPCLSYSNSDFCCSFMTYSILLMLLSSFRNTMLCFNPFLGLIFWHAFALYRDVILFLILFFFLIITLYGSWPRYISVAHFYVKLVFQNS